MTNVEKWHGAAALTRLVDKTIVSVSQDRSSLLSRKIEIHFADGTCLSLDGVSGIVLA